MLMCMWLAVNPKTRGDTFHSPRKPPPSSKTRRRFHARNTSLCALVGGWTKTSGIPLRFRVTLSQQFTKRREEMGLPWDAVLHSTRHTALTDLGAAGGDAFTIQAIAGHASVTTSQRYE